MNHPSQRKPSTLQTVVRHLSAFLHSSSQSGATSPGNSETSEAQQGLNNTLIASPKATRNVKHHKQPANPKSTHSRALVPSGQHAPIIDASTALQELLEVPGVTNMQRPVVYRYTIKHIDTRTKRPVTHLQKLVHDEFMDHAPPSKTSTKVSNTTYLASAPWTSNNENGEEEAVEGYFLRTHFQDAENLTLLRGEPLNSAGDCYTETIDGIRDDGTLNRRWLRFDGYDPLPTICEGGGTSIRRKAV